jgi:hypothetical protein
MAINDLVTGTATRVLPPPMQNGYSEEVLYRGTTHRMANGGLVRENVSTTMMRVITYEWAQLTSADRSIVEAAVADMIDGSTASLTAPTGATYTVVLGETLPQWQVRKVGGGTLRYSGKLVLEKSA